MKRRGQACYASLFPSHPEHTLLEELGSWETLSSPLSHYLSKDEKESRGAVSIPSFWDHSLFLVGLFSFKPLGLERNDVQQIKDE